MSEEWRAIPGFPGYEVSDQGRVKALARVEHHKNGRVVHRRERIFRAKPGGNGYPAVRLAGRLLCVHRLVLLAFVGPCPEGMETLHGDGTRTNNALTNLRYGTHSENQRDMVAHGTNRNAGKTHCPQNHPYDEANTKVIPSRPTARYCRACLGMHRARYRERRSTEQNLTKLGSFAQ